MHEDSFPVGYVFSDGVSFILNRRGIAARWWCALVIVVSYKHRNAGARRWAWPVGQAAWDGATPEPGDIIVFFYAPSGGTDPGFYGWAVILEWLPGSKELYFRPVAPSDQLKMHPWWSEAARTLADKIRGKMKQRTLWHIPDELSSELRAGISSWVNAGPPKKPRDYKQELETLMENLAESILNATDDEIREEIRVEGLDPSAVAAEVRDALYYWVKDYRLQSLRDARKAYDQRVAAMQRK